MLETVFHAPPLSYLNPRFSISVSLPMLSFVSTLHWKFKYIYRWYHICIWYWYWLILIFDIILMFYTHSYIEPDIWWYLVMSYPHKFGPMYDDSSFMIIFLSCMINVDHGLYHDPYEGDHYKTQWANPQKVKM